MFFLSASLIFLYLLWLPLRFHPLSIPCFLRFPILNSYSSHRNEYRWRGTTVSLATPFRFLFLWTVSIHPSPALKDLSSIGPAMAVRRDRKAQGGHCPPLPHTHIYFHPPPFSPSLVCRHIRTCLKGRILARETSTNAWLPPSGSKQLAPSTHAAAIYAATITRRRRATSECRWKLWQ